MSFYNMLFGRNPAAELLMAMLNLTPSDVGRFRDCYTNNDGTEIIVFTRNGGGNREYYQGVLDALAKHPNYIRDEDEDYDCTYASIYFHVPEPFKEHVKVLADASDTRPAMEKFKGLIDDLESGKDNATTGRALEVGKKIFAAIESGQSQKASTPEGAVQIIDGDQFPSHEINPEQKAKS